jgi:2-C-methyl-D-erythritol 4-phosphate cytidylyltransferase
MVAGESNPPNPDADRFFTIPDTPPVNFDAVIVAAGSSTRFGGVDKLSADLCGRPVLAWSLSLFESVPGLGCLVVVTGPERIAQVTRMAEQWCPQACFRVVEGGARRRDSVEAGLRECSNRYAAIHDGARPLATVELVERTLAAARGPGAIAATPVTDTIKEVRSGTIVGHPERAHLWAAQTPQVVLRQAWLDAAAMSDNDETDDAAMLSRLGLECAVVDGSPENLKITRPLDLDIAAAILRERGLG